MLSINIKNKKCTIIVIIIAILAIVVSFIYKKLMYTEKNIDNNQIFDVFDIYPIFQNPVNKKNYLKRYNELFPYFLINEAKVNSKPLDFIRLGLKGDDGCIYIVPKYALEKADAVIGYGIKDVITFEEQYSDIYNKNSYGYDCGIKSIPIKNKKCHFKSECIGTDKNILTSENQISSKHIHSFGENILKLGLNDKKYFVKMDIAGAEINVMDDILKNKDNITGFALAIHLYNTKQISPTIKMLKEIEKNFILVQRNTQPMNVIRGKIKFECPSGKGYYSTVMVLSYINKNLIDEYKIANNQSSISTKWEGSQYNPYPTDIVKWKLYPTIFKKNIKKFFDFDLPKLIQK